MSEENSKGENLKSKTDRFSRLVKDAGKKKPKPQHHHTDLWEGFGGYWGKTAKGIPKRLNPAYWAAAFSRDTGIIWDPIEAEEKGSFFRYVESPQHPDFGLWVPSTVQQIQHELDRYVRRVSKGLVDRNNSEGLCPEELVDVLKLESLKETMQALMGHPDVFRAGAFAHPLAGVVYVKNGRLQIFEDGRLEFTEGNFRREDMQRQRLDITFNPRAKARRVRTWLRRIFKGRRDDIAAVSRAFGAALYGNCPWKTMIVIQGDNDRGKTRVGAIAAVLAGADRTSTFVVRELGNDKFENHRFVGRHLLLANECPDDFLMTPAAGKLKDITGGDQIPVKIKFKTSQPLLFGEKLVIASTNFPIRVKVGVDRGAWETRLIYLQADGEGYSRDEQIAKFVPKLFGDTEEASGILNMAISGLRQILRAGKDRDGVWYRSEEQQARMRSVMDHSDTVRKWVEDCVTYDGNGDGITTSEAWGAYFRWCKIQKQHPWPERQFQIAIKGAIEDAYGKTQSHDCRRGDSQQRGWTGLGFRSSGPNND